MKKWLWIFPILAVLVIDLLLFCFGWNVTSAVIIAAALIIVAVIFVSLWILSSLRMRLKVLDKLTQGRSA